MKAVVCLAMMAGPIIGLSQDSEENGHFLSLYGGQSAILLGSSEHRIGAGFSYASAKHEPRFENRGLTSQFVWEGYYDHTRDSVTRSPYLDSDTVGFLFYGRWFARMPRTSPRPFLDFGWGFQYADRRTPDLPSEVNSTPFADLGYAFPSLDGHQLMISVRYLHISNAGFVSPNRGQNQIFLMASVSY